MRTDSPLLLLLGSEMSQKKDLRPSREAAWQFSLQKTSEQREVLRADSMQRCWLAKAAAHRL